jgi:arginine/lysine/histidine transporter system substrate-binding protein
MKLKPIIAGSACIIAAFSLMSCSGSAHGGNLSEIVSSKTLVVGTNAEYAPFEYLDASTNTVVGYDMDVVALIKEAIETEYSIELNVVISDMSFDGLIGSMNSNQIDFIAAAFSKNAEREETLLFSDIYYQAQTVLVTKEDNTSITDMASLNGLSLGAQLGTVQVDFATEAVGESGEIKALASISTLILDLNAGNIDAICVEKPVAQTIVAANEGLKIIDTIAFADDEGYGFASNYGCESLISLINGVISTNQANGVLDSLFVDALNESLGIN